MLKTMFIAPVEHGNCFRKEYFIKLWNSGKAFRELRGNHHILSINSIDMYRPLYDRICIQYDMGIVEV